MFLHGVEAPQRSSHQYRCAEHLADIQGKKDLFYVVLYQLAFGGKERSRSSNKTSPI